MNIGRKMALRRKEIHMTPAKVAMLCGMLPAEYKLIESGKKDPTLAELQNIAEALRIRPEHLMATGSSEGGVQTRVERTDEGATVHITWGKEYSSNMIVAVSAEDDRSAQIILKKVKA